MGGAFTHRLGCFESAAPPAGLSYVGGKAEFKVDASGTVSLTDLTGGSDAAPSAGDIVILAIGDLDSIDHTEIITTADYTTIADLYVNDVSDANLLVAYKVLPTAETGIIIDPVSNCVVAIHVWRGVNATPLDVASTTATGTDSGLPNPPAITPTTAGAVVIAIGVGGYQSSVAFGSSDLENFVTLAVEAGTLDPAIGIGSFEWVSGSFDPATWTGTTSTNASWAAVTLALRPA
jgi:hypothetical protein